MDHGSSEGPSGAGLRGRDLLGLGGVLVGGVVGGLVVGLLVDQAAGTSPLFVLVGIALGVLAAGVGFWLRVRAALRE
jgi:F0F1-type ATP synthase assembly protein I